MLKKILVALGILFFISAMAYAQTADYYPEEPVQNNELVEEGVAPAEDAQDFSRQMQYERQQKQSAPRPAQRTKKYSQQEAATSGNMTPEDSLAFYESALKEDPNNYVALTALGDLYANVRADIHKSIKCYEKAIEINDRYDLAHFGLGMDYAGLQMYDEARREFQKTLMVSKRSYVQEAAQDALMSLGQ